MSLIEDRNQLFVVFTWMDCDAHRARKISSVAAQTAHAEKPSPGRLTEEIENDQRQPIWVALVLQERLQAALRSS